MGLTKSEIFTRDQNRLSVMLKALAHPARVAILQHIIKSGSCICNDLVNELKLAQPTISQHLKELKNAGVIQGTIKGVSVSYSINQVTWHRMKNELGGFFATYRG
jgi:predicted transcriptional regulator